MKLLGQSYQRFKLTQREVFVGFVVSFTVSHKWWQRASESIQEATAISSREPKLA
jgi:hypothetical protein